jgi:PAS domain S-box-containing protein
MNKIIQQSKSETPHIRCLKCDKLLAKHYKVGQLEIKCLRCGALNKAKTQNIEQVIIMDTSGKILFINKAVEKVTGYKVSEVLGKKPSELWGGHMPKNFYKKMWEDLVDKKIPVKLKMKNKNKAGEFYEVELIVSPILDDKKKVMFYIGIEVVIK